MNTFVIIDEYRWTGRKQLLLERVQDEFGDAVFRVTVVKRFPTFDAAREFYMQEIPEARQDYHSGIIDAYAAKHGVKAPQGRRRWKRAQPRGGNRS